MTDNVINRVDMEPSSDFIIDSILNGTDKRQDEIRSLVDILNRIEGNYSIFIDGEWGIGKTIFVNQVSIALQSLNQSACKDDTLRSRLDKVRDSLHLSDLIANGTLPTYYPLYLNAWSQDFGEDPLILISSLIAENFEEHVDLATRGKSIRDSIARFVASFKPSLLIPFPDTAQQVSVELDFGQAIGVFSKTDFLEHHKERKQFKEDIHSALGDSAEGRADRFVLFVDELDRCRPEFAIKILETLRLFFDQENLTIVFSANARALGESISSWYGGGFDGHRYLMRFYDMARSLTSFDIVHFLSLNGINVRRSSCIVKCISGHSLTMRDINRCLQELKAIHKREPSKLIESICLSFSCEIACLIGSKGQAARRDVLSGKGIYLLREWVSEYEGVSEYVEPYAKSSKDALLIPGMQFNSDGNLTVDPLLAIEGLYTISFFETADLDELEGEYNGRAKMIRRNIRTYFNLDDR